MEFLLASWTVHDSPLTGTCGVFAAGVPLVLLLLAAGAVVLAFSGCLLAPPPIPTDTFAGGCWSNCDSVRYNSKCRHRSKKHEVGVECVVHLNCEHSIEHQNSPETHRGSVERV